MVDSGGGLFSQLWPACHSHPLLRPRQSGHGCSPTCAPISKLQRRRPTTPLDGSAKAKPMWDQPDPPTLRLGFATPRPGRPQPRRSRPILAGFQILSKCPKRRPHLLVSYPSRPVVCCARLVGNGPSGLSERHPMLPRKLEVFLTKRHAWRTTSAYAVHPFVQAPHPVSGPNRPGDRPGPT